jgi:hypothetical protein
MKQTSQTPLLMPAATRLNSLIPPEIKNDEFYNLIYGLAGSELLKTVILYFSITFPDARICRPKAAERPLGVLAGRVQSHASRWLFDVSQADEMTSNMDRG